MKRLSLIFLAWILLLTLQPSVALACTSVQSACAENCDTRGCEEEEASDDCCLAGICNPCGMCYCLCCSLAERHSLHADLPVSGEQVAIELNSQALAGHRAVPHHPPEV